MYMSKLMHVDRNVVAGTDGSAGSLIIRANKGPGLVLARRLLLKLAERSGILLRERSEPGIILMGTGTSEAGKVLVERPEVGLILTERCEAGMIKVFQSKPIKCSIQISRSK